MLSATHRIHHCALHVQPGAEGAAADELAAVGRSLHAQMPAALQAACDATAPEGLWLVRRLCCRLAVDADDSALDLRLQAALRAALAASAFTDVQIERFADNDDALLACWGDALAGRSDRAWAWARLGYWPSSAQAGSAALAAVIETLAAQPPALRRRALAQAAARELLPRALAQVSIAQWCVLAAGLPGGEALRAALSAEVADRSLTQGGTQMPGALHEQAGQRASVAAHGSVEAAALAWLSSTAAARALAAAPLPPSLRGTAAVVTAWLAALEAQPSRLALPEAARELRTIAAALLAPLALAPARSPREALTPSQATSPRVQAPARDAEIAQPTAGLSTQHAGLLFLLRFLPAWLDSPDGSALTRERLWWLAVDGLAVPEDDLVVRAFSGCEPARSLRPTSGDAEQTEQDVAALRTGLAQLLPATDAIPDPLRYLIDRSAQLQYAPGRWNCVFEAAQAEPRLRRVGLDLDPGWLPWLATTVEFSYE
jgi:hypothetical protein